MSSDNDNKLHKAIADLINPVVRVGMRHDLSLADLTEALRLQAVKTSIERFSLPGVVMTNARIAVLTGLSRKQVARLRRILEEDSTLPLPPKNRAQRVVQGWLGDKEFLDAKNNPLVLPIKNEIDGVENGSFKALVQRYSGDATFRTVLEELNRIQMTLQPTPEHVELVTKAYVPKKNMAEQTRLVAKSVTEVFETAFHNTDPSKKDDDKPRLQKQITYSGVSECFVGELEKHIRDEVDKLDKKLRIKLAEAQEKSENRSDLKTTIGLGMYYIEYESDPKKDEEK